MRGSMPISGAHKTVQCLGGGRGGRRCDVGAGGWPGEWACW